MGTVITAAGLGKNYQIGADGGNAFQYRSIRDSITSLFRAPFARLRSIGNTKTPETFWALKDVSFEVREGEVLGVIGRNGAGKSTLLKILSRITEPSEGRAKIKGRVGSLLEVGTGFHPELTGRENIFLNGTILGMRRSEIPRKFDEIVDFSGVETFLDTPVKRYSSGMYVRLAFSVAAHLDPEILLVDEVLAVGDAEFREKCLGKMRSVTGEGRTVLFVSHNMSAIRNLCSRVLLFEGGQLALDADPEAAISQYLDKNMRSGAVVTCEEFGEEIEGSIRRNDPTIQLLKVSVADDEGRNRSRYNSDEPIHIAVDYACLCTVHDLRVVVYLVDEENQPILVSQNVDAKSETENHHHRNAGRYVSQCTIRPNTMGGKRWYLTIHLIHPKVEHIILNKVLAVDVDFQGYNGIHEPWPGTYLRPQLDWKTWQ